MTPQPADPSTLRPVSLAPPVLSSPASWVGLAAVLVALDYVTAATVLIPILFLVPVALAAWHRRPRWATALIAGLVAARFGLELSAADLWTSAAAVTNAVLRLVSLASVALFTDYAAGLRREASDPSAEVSDRALPAAFGHPGTWAGLTVALQAADYLTGPSVLVPALYLYPVALAAWHRRMGWAFGLTAVLVGGRLALALHWGAPWGPGPALVNAGLRVVGLGGVAVFAGYAASLRGEPARAAELPQLGPVGRAVQLAWEAAAVAGLLALVAWSVYWAGRERPD